MVSTTDVVIEQQPIESKPIDPTNISEDEFEKAQKTFQLGKKNLLLNKFDEAVNNIGDACKIYTSKYGELDQHCAEIYFYYGKALLELARVETTVLGNALNGVPEDTEPINDSRYGNPEDVAAEEMKEISEKVIDAMCEKDAESKEEEEKSAEKTEESAAVVPSAPATEEEPKKPEDEIKPATDETPKAAGEEVKEKNGDEATPAAGEGDEEVDEEEEEDDEEDVKDDEQIKDEAEADEISNLQRSWEMFELAKVVYTKQPESEDDDLKKRRIAECLMKLGEISIEQEIYDQAITDITESVKLQEEAKERDERMLAESFYQLGLAYQFNNQFPEANEAYQKSTNILQLRIEKLKGQFELSNDDLEKNAFKEEIADLETLLPEMLSKLEEVSEQGQQSMSLIKEAKECFINSIANSAQAANGDGAAEVKDITSLVKSKRKISASGEVELGNKKSKVDDEDSTPAQNGCSNGDTEKPATNGDSEKAITETAPAEKC